MGGWGEGRTASKFSFAKWTEPFLVSPQATGAVIAPAMQDSMTTWRGRGRSTARCRGLRKHKGLCEGMCVRERERHAKKNINKLWNGKMSFCWEERGPGECVCVDGDPLKANSSSRYCILYVVPLVPHRSGVLFWGRFRSNSGYCCWCRAMAKSRSVWTV